MTCALYVMISVIQRSSPEKKKKKKKRAFVRGTKKKVEKRLYVAEMVEVR